MLLIEEFFPIFRRKFYFVASEFVGVVTPGGISMLLFSFSRSFFHNALVKSVSRFAWIRFQTPVSNKLCSHHQFLFGKFLGITSACIPKDFSMLQYLIYLSGTPDPVDVCSKDFQVQFGLTFQRICAYISFYFETYPLFISQIRTPLLQLFMLVKAKVVVFLKGPERFIFSSEKNKSRRLSK